MNGRQPGVATRRFDAAPRTRHGPSQEDGQITLLIVGVALVAILLIVVTVAVTSVALARTRLMDAADGAALTAANALDESVYADSGIGEAVPLSDASVRGAANDHLASLERPVGILDWALAQGTGSPDQATAVVVLTGRVRVPFAAAVGSDASIGITVESRARAPLR